MKQLIFVSTFVLAGVSGCIATSADDPGSTSTAASESQEANVKPGEGSLQHPKTVTIDQASIDRMREDILNNGLYKRVPETQAKGLLKAESTVSTGGATMAFPMKDPRAACPGGYVYYIQDDEDSHTSSQMELYQDDVTNFTIQTKIDYATLIPFLSAGGIEFPRVRRNAGTQESNVRDTQITFCREWVNYLPQVSKNAYVVISADGNCPFNSYKYVRVIDNEDTGNTSMVEPTNLPGIQITSAGDSRLTMCFVPANPHWQDVLPKAYADRYWFFSNAVSANYRGSQFIDNEDNGNANSWSYVEDQTWFPLVKQIMGDGPNTHWYFAGLDDGYAPLVFLTKHSARYAAELACANARDSAYSAANSKALGTAANTAIATTAQDWTALKGTVTGWTDYAGSFLTTNTAYDNCMSQAQLISE